MSKVNIRVDSVSIMSKVNADDSVDGQVNSIFGNDNISMESEC